MQAQSYKNGFTLVEMSVILIIIGLIIGGIVLGRELLREAELRSVMSDSEKIQSAIYSFQKKYDYLPGDFPRAESYWGQDNASCPVVATNVIPKVATCNGDGNGKINTPAGGHVCAGVTALSYEQEPYRLWQHLSDAGMFPGFYTGVQGSGTSGVLYGMVGINIPQSSKLDKVGFQLMNFDGVSTTIGWLTSVRFSNVLFIGREDNVGPSGTPCLEPTQPFVSPAEAYDLDKKIDDGLPGSGNLRVYSDNSLLCADNATPGSAAYVKNIARESCSLIQLLAW
jgi:hypothetical protein